MKSWMTYIPLLIFIVILFTFETGGLKSVLLGITTFAMILAKYNRGLISAEEVEYDERVSNNISHWSFYTLIILNFLLFVGVFLDVQNIVVLQIEGEGLLLILALLLFIPLYVVPAIVKKF